MERTNENSYVNKAYVTGNLGHDPELRHTQTGRSVATLRVATAHRGQDGKNRTEWHRIVVWGKHAEHVVERLKKGDRVTAEGHLRTSTWTDARGTTRHRTEIHGRVIFPRDEQDPPAGTAENDSTTTNTTGSTSSESTQQLSDNAKERAAYVVPAGTPRCAECGDITVRNGTCYVCATCGTTTGCS